MKYETVVKFRKWIDVFMASIVFINFFILTIWVSHIDWLDRVAQRLPYQWYFIYIFYGITMGLWTIHKWLSDAIYGMEESGTMLGGGMAFGDWERRVWTYAIPIMGFYIFFNLGE